MKRYLPGRVELFVFASLALICATIAAAAPSRDAAMSLLAFPIFIFAAVMGLWKSGRLRADPVQSAAATLVTRDPELE
jgi:hypothetical protein